MQLFDCMEQKSDISAKNNEKKKFDTHTLTNDNKKKKFDIYTLTGDNKEKEKENDTYPVNTGGPLYCACGETVLADQSCYFCKHCEGTWRWIAGKQRYELQDTLPLINIVYAGTKRSSTSNCVCNKTRLYLSGDYNIIC